MSGDAAAGVAAVLLAAGRSSRMGRNKLLIEDGAGRSMVARTLGTCWAAACGGRCTWSSGHEAALLQAALLRVADEQAVRVVEAPDHAEGLSASLRAGLAAVPGDGRGGAGVPGRHAAGRRPSDRQPARRLRPRGGAIRGGADRRGVRGNPVLWGRRHVPALRALTGDAGARRLFDALTGELHEVETGDAAVLRDFDTPEALATMPA